MDLNEIISLLPEDKRVEARAAVEATTAEHGKLREMLGVADAKLAGFEQAEIASKTKELTLGVCQLADPALYEHVAAVTGVRAKKDTTGWVLENREALEKWAKDPANASRVAPPRRQTASGVVSTPVPPLPPQPGGFSDPVSQQIFAGLPPKSKERILRQMANKNQ